jgi:hypothetical protein
LGQRFSARRLRDECVEASLDAEPFVVGLSATSEADQARSVGRPARSQMTDDFSAVHAGHLKIDECQMWLERTGGRQSGGSVESHSDAATHNFQQSTKPFGGINVVIHHKNSNIGCGSRRLVHDVPVWGGIDKSPNAPARGERRRERRCDDPL